MDYLDWQSDLSLAVVFGESESFSYASMLAELGVLYLSKNKQDNRSVLVLDSGSISANITPAPFNLQTRVNEYGGKPYWALDSSVVFSNMEDQCLYRQELSDKGASSPRRISCRPTPEAQFMFTDVHAIGEAGYLSIVELEKAKVAHANNAMFIGLISHDSESEPISLIQGADFYSNLVVNKDKTRVAWVQWNHPNMPWDDTELWVARIQQNEGALALENPQKISVSNTVPGGASICQLMFSNNNRLFFSADYRASCDNSISSDSGTDHWNVHAYDFLGEKIVRVTTESREYGYPHWVYGDHRIVQFTETKLLTISSAPSGDKLILIDQASLECVEVFSEHGACTLQHLGSDGAGGCVLSKLPFDARPSLIKLDWCERTNSVVTQALIEPAYVALETSDAKEICFATRDGQHAHGFYYEPVNSTQAALTDETALPPLLVMVHGGPTARAYGHFDLQKQFWTSRGFAILDINHRGSSGYGRAFRDSLYGEWGELDASDIADGVDYLVGQKKVDPRRICIRGKSAGGYAVLRALTEYPTLFRVGACYYGIGNLLTLAESTHKFEKHYTDRLIDEVFDADSSKKPESKFYQRSPINKMTNLDCAMIVFQGGLDRVVPPSVALEVIAVLNESGIDHEYVEYPNEGHGFKIPKNNIDAWQKELEFYQRVLRGEIPHKLSSL